MFLIKRSKNLFIVPKARQEQYKMNFLIFYFENQEIGNAIWRCLFIKRNRFMKNSIIIFSHFPLPVNQILSQA